MKLYTYLIFTIILFSCKPDNKRQERKMENSGKRMELRYAKGFSVTYFDEYTELKVKNPWDTTQNLGVYILVPKCKDLPTSLPEGKVIRIPIDRVAICSAVHAGMWNQLGQANSIIGVCEPEYIKIPTVLDGLKAGKITDFGMASNINIERLVATNPELLVVSPFENSPRNSFDKVNIAVVKDASYMEQSPLGRTEWLKFEATFTQSEKLADEIFSKIEKRYVELSKLAVNTKNKPTVFTEKKYGDSWYIAGGKSFMGEFLNDAGANYLWKELDQTGSAAMSFETVYAKAIHADYWLIKYNEQNSDLSYKQLGIEYNLYSNFDAYKNHHIFAINTAKTPFYEVGPLEPDVVLADLVSIFHPELLPGYKPKYYFNLKAE